MTPNAMHAIQKAACPDQVVLVRWGDFWETYREDADTVCRVVGLTLTSRNGVPMAGFPWQATDRYVRKLLDGGVRVHLCEVK